MSFIRVDREHPFCILILIDQSGTMGETWRSQTNTSSKAVEVTTQVHRIMAEFVYAAEKEGKYRDYFHMGVIGYGGTVHSLLGQEILLPISEVAHIAELAGPDKKKVLVWFYPLAEGSTPMCAAFKLAHNALQTWVNEHANCNPPFVFNITDGESTDGDPTNIAKQIMELRTKYGNALLFNCHISSLGNDEVMFPATLPAPLKPIPYAERLFNISSIIPDDLRKEAEKYEMMIPQGGRGFIFNAKPENLTKFLEIGTVINRFMVPFK